MEHESEEISPELLKIYEEREKEDEEKEALMEKMDNFDTNPGEALAAAMEVLERFGKSRG